MIECKVLLASASPRRAALLKELEVDFRVVTSNVEEIVPKSLELGDVACYLARLKGDSCMHMRNEGEVLLAADTIVVHNNEVLGKPLDAGDAASILRRLSGAEHRVMTGVYINNGIRIIEFVVESLVEFDELSDEEIRFYIDGYKPFDKAGSYGIQEWIGWSKVKKIDGSYSNIMGLPTREVYQSLLDLQ